MRVIASRSALAWPLLATVVALWTAACSRSPAEAAAAVTSPPASSASTAAIPHGDHSPHHGGTVWMYKDVHFEVVFDPSGRHRIYFSDATRQDLPASIASRVTITVERPSFTSEIVQATIDGQGESWIADGAPVKGHDIVARVAFTLADDSYWIDLPFDPKAE